MRERGGPIPVVLFLLLWIAGAPGQEIPPDHLTALDRAQQLHDQGRLSDAEALLAASLGEELPRNRDALTLLLQIRLEAMDLDGVLSAGWGSLPLIPSSAEKNPPAMQTPESALILGQTLLLMDRTDVAIPVLEATARMSAIDQRTFASAQLILGLAQAAHGLGSTVWEPSLVQAESAFRDVGDEIGASTCRLHLWRARMDAGVLLTHSDFVAEARGDLTTIFELAERRRDGPLAAGASLLSDELDEQAESAEVGRSAESASGRDASSLPPDLVPLLRARHVLEANPRPARRDIHLPNWLLPDPSELYRQLVVHLMTRVEEAGGTTPGGAWPDAPAGRAAWEAFFFADRMHARKAARLRAAIDTVGPGLGRWGHDLDVPDWPMDPAELFLFASDLTSRLGEMDGALLEYVLHRDASYAFVVTEQGLAAEKLSITRREVDSLVVDVVGPWYRRGASGVELSSFRPDSAQRAHLYVSLFMALEGYFPQQGPLLTVPDGSLMFFPLEMLLRPAPRPLTPAQLEAARSHLLGDWESERVLLERYNFCYITSSSDLFAGDRMDQVGGVPSSPAPRAVLWSGPSGRPAELILALPSWEKLRDFFIPELLFRPPYADSESSGLLLSLMRLAAATLTAQPESQVRAEEAGGALSLLEVVEPPAVVQVDLPFFPREVESWNSFLLVGTREDRESSPQTDPSVERVTVAQLRDLPLSGTFLSLTSGCVLNQLRPYLEGGPSYLPWDDLSAKAGSSLLALRLAASEARIRALAVSLWPVGQAQVMHQARVYDHVASLHDGEGIQASSLVRAWNEARRDLRYVVSELDDPHHVVSLAHPFFWAGSVLTPAVF